MRVCVCVRERERERERVSEKLGIHGMASVIFGIKNDSTEERERERERKMPPENFVNAHLFMATRVPVHV